MACAGPSASRENGQPSSGAAGLASRVSALLSHVAFGVLLGIGMRLRARHLPLAAFLAIAPDLDHLPIPGLVARETFTNVFLLTALPALAYVALVWRGHHGERARLALAGVVLLSSHMVLDMWHIDDAGHRSRVAIFWPAIDGTYSFAEYFVTAVDPRAFSTTTLVLSILALGAILANATHTAVRRFPRFARPAAVAFALAAIATFPALAATGILTHEPRHPVATFTVEDARVVLPAATLRANLTPHGGTFAPYRLVVEVHANGSRLASYDRNTTLPDGDTWTLNATLPIDQRREGPYRLVVRFNTSTDKWRYLDAPVDLERTHVDTTLNLTSYTREGRGQATLVLRNEGNATLPLRAIRLELANATGAVVLNTTNLQQLGRNALWIHATSAPSGDTTWRLRVTSVDDGHVYLDRPVRARDKPLAEAEG